MTILFIVITTFVAVEFLYIMYLETVITTSDKTVKVFKMTKEQISNPQVVTLFKNQGVYNGLLALLLLYGLYISHSLELVTLLLIYIVAVAAYGALTSDKFIILKQGGLAIIALISLLF